MVRHTYISREVVLVKSAHDLGNKRSGLAWPDCFFSAQCLRIRIISACLKKGLVQNQYVNLSSHPETRGVVINRILPFKFQATYTLEVP